MEPRQQEWQKTPQERKEEEKKRPRFRPGVERLEERISLSGLGLGHGHGQGPPFLCGPRGGCPA